MPERAADIVVRARNKKLRRDLKQSEKLVAGMGKRAGRGLKDAFKAGLGNVAAFGSVAGIATLGAEVLEFERGFTRLGIQAELAGTEFDRGAFRTAITDLSVDTGIAKNDVLKLADEIVNLEGAAGLTTGKLETLTLAAQGTGTEMAELAGLTLGLRDAFEISEVDDLNSALSRFITIGGQGSVPLKELARGLRSSAGSFARLQGAGEDSAATLAGVFQVAAAGGITTVDATSTAVQRLVSNLEILGKSEAKKLGIRDAAGELRPLEEILERIGKSGIINDPKKFKKAFPSEPARKLLQILVKNRVQLDKFVKSSEGSTALNDSAEKFADSTSGRLDIALNRLKLAITEAFTPERVEALVSAAETLADAVGLVIDNVWGLVAAWTAFKALQLASALGKGATAARAMGAAAQTAATGLGAVGVGGNTAAAGLTAAGTAGKAAGFAGMAANVARVGSALSAAAAGGFLLGTALDEFFDISGQFAEAFAEPDISPSQEFEAQEKVRKQASAAAAPADETEIETTIREQGEGAEELAKFTARQALSGSPLLSLIAQETGVLDALAPGQVQGEGERAESLQLSEAAGIQKRREIEAAEKDTARVAEFIKIQSAGELTPREADKFSSELGAQVLFAGIEAAIVAGMAKASITMDGDKLNTATANTPSNRRSQPQ